MHPSTEPAATLRPADPAATLRLALDKSAFAAARGERPPSRLVKGSADQVWQVVRRFRAQTQHEYVSFDDPGYLVRARVPDRIIALGPRTMRPMIERGVRVQQITTRTGLSLDAGHGTILWSHGADARVVDTLPFKAGVYDRSVAMIPVDLSVFANGILVVTDPVIVRLVLTLQSDLWSKGTAPPALDGPPEHLRPLLPLLTSGVSDAVAATRAGMSMRTYSRRVGELMRLLGARSRFQAGAEAVRRGWL